MVKIEPTGKFWRTLSPLKAALITLLTVNKDITSRTNKYNKLISINNAVRDNEGINKYYINLYSQFLAKITV